MKIIRYVMVRLGDLKPSKLKKQIQGGKLDPDKIERLKESVTKSGFWGGLAAQEIDGDYYILFGHHRLAAAIAVLGEDYKTSIALMDCTEDEAAVAFANENSEADGAKFGMQVDTVVLIHKQLKAHPDWCKIKFPIQIESETRAEGRPKGSHEHGSERCISAFLGVLNWSQPTVHRLLASAGLHEEVKDIVEDQGKSSAHKAEPGKVGTGSASTINTLTLPAQQEFARAVKAENVALPVALIKEVVSTVKEAAAEEAKPIQQKEATKIVEKLSIPSAVVTKVAQAASLPTKEAQPAITKALESAGVPTATAKATATRVTTVATATLIDQQKTAVRAGVQAAAESQRKDEALQKAKDLNSVAQRLIGDLVEFDLNDVLDEDDLKEIVKLREHVSRPVLFSLIKSFRRVAQTFNEYAEKLEAPAPKQLRG